jgi:hypothetical protein
MRCYVVCNCHKLDALHHTARKKEGKVSGLLLIWGFRGMKRIRAFRDIFHLLSPSLICKSCSLLCSSCKSVLVALLMRQINRDSWLHAECRLGCETS